MVATRISRALAAAAALVAAAACAHRGGEPFTRVSIEDVERMLAQPDVFVVDANTAEVFRRNHLPGARRWKSAPAASLLPAEKDRPIVFYCASPS
jgi:rhodanese-related sulfurtransferase